MQRLYNTISKKIIASFVFIFVFILPIVGNAYSISNEGGLDTTAEGTGHSGIPLVNSDSPWEIIGAIIGIVLSLLGVIFLILIIYGGFLWMTARGNEEQVNKAKKIIKNSIIGIIIVLGAYAVTVFIGSALS